MINIIRWFLGYVEFIAQGGFTERFLNLCKINELNMWQVKNDGVKVIAFTSNKDYKKLCEFAINAGMSTEVVREYGAPFILKKHKRRIGICVGGFITVVLVFILSGLIWNVEVVGNDDVKNKTFTESLENLGVKTGAFKSKIDILDVQDKLKDEYPELSWVSLNIFGGKAQLEYTLIKKAPLVVDEKTITNIVASKNGKITLVEGYKGTNLIKDGDFVAKGSLLISGVIENSDGSEKLVHAQGKVFAETKTIFKSKQDRKCRLVITDEPLKNYAFKLLLVKIPLGKEKYEGLSTFSEIFLKGNNTELPFGFIRQDSLNLKEAEGVLSQKQVELLAMADLLEKKRENYKNGEIKKVEYSLKNNQNFLEAEAIIIAKENIGKEKTVKIEEN